MACAPLVGRLAEPALVGPVAVLAHPEYGHRGAAALAGATPLTARPAPYAVRAESNRHARVPGEKANTSS
ncbi:hypothetical protein ACIHFB_18910 [Streptomyces sp. NPDC051963]|uniref:hypothetical protein n=1 Tax=Streptomyces sp. NPDC051963 TaxID=3365678 RepID=UPI0037D4D59A